MLTFPTRFPPFPHRLRGALRRAAALGALLGGLGLCASAQETTSPMATVELAGGIHLIHAELANNDAARMRGLMFRRTLEPNHGMLFVFDGTDQHCMWMRNTLLPLAVAFIDDDGTIANIEEMKAQTDDRHCARRPVRYALEMAGGWFSAHGLHAGSPLQGIAAAGRR